MRLHQLTYPYKGGKKRLAYWSRGNPQNDSVVVCVHGLLRHSRDFDEIAVALASNHYVICPDLPGRGLSESLDNAEDYHPELYLEALAPLLSKFRQRQIHWIGTSLGGLLGMALASQPKSPINRLVLNDIGPELPQTALHRIASYISAPHFRNLQEVDQFLRQTYESFVGLSDQQWQRLTKYGSKPHVEGGFVLHYDPLIAANTAASANQRILLWELWESIMQPCLLVHGLTSDLLTPAIVNQMQSTHPDMRVLQRPGIGHAPSLMLESEVDEIKKFIDGDPI